MVTEVQGSLIDDSTTQALTLQLLLDPAVGPTHNTYLDALLHYKEKLYICSKKECRAKIIIKIHSSYSGYGGIHATLK